MTTASRYSSADKSIARVYMFVGRRLQPAPNKRIGAHGLRQNSGAGWSLRPPDWARLTDWPGKRRLPRAPKELSVIESGGSTRPIPLFYNGVNCLHLGDQFAMFGEPNRQTVTGSKVRLSTGNRLARPEQVGACDQSTNSNAGYYKYQPPPAQFHPTPM